MPRRARRRVSRQPLARIRRTHSARFRKSPGFTRGRDTSRWRIGIGANTTIFTFVNAVLLRPLPYPASDRLVVLRERPLRSEGTVNVHPVNFVEWRARARSFEALALVQTLPAERHGQQRRRTRSPGFRRHRNCFVYSAKVPCWAASSQKRRLVQGATTLSSLATASGAVGLAVTLACSDEDLTVSGRGRLASLASRRQDFELA